jgi:hypothetical protein
MPIRYATQVRAAAATLPPARVTAAEDPKAPATNPTASAAANSRNGARRAGRHRRMAASVTAIVARQSTAMATNRSGGYGRYT